MRVRILITALLLGAPVAPRPAAQWVNHPTPGLPAPPTASPNLAAPAPRTSHGTPDLSGVWQAEPAPIPELIKMRAGRAERARARTSRRSTSSTCWPTIRAASEPLQPKAAAHAARLSLDTVQHDDVGINCLPSGLPMFITTPAPFKIVQTPGPHRDAVGIRHQLPPDLHGRAQAPGRSAALVDGFVDWPLGGRHARGRDHRLQRPRTARRDGASPQQRAAPDRALHPPQHRAHGRAVHVRRSRDVHDSRSR